MPDLVRARINGFEKNVSRAYAEANGFEVLSDEPITLPDGRPRPTTRLNGRPTKKRVSVAKKAPANKAVTESADQNKEQSQ